MADNAIEKLFDEMREAKRKIAQCNAEEARLSEARNANTKALKAALDHAEILNVTLDKHIHEGMPVLQAKMQAHVDTTQTTAQIGRLGTNLVARNITVNTISASTLITNIARLPRRASPGV